MKLRNIIIISLVTLVVGCAGIGVKNSPDPSKKVTYAYQAMYKGRFVPANRLLNEAIEIYKERKDNLGLAHAYIGFGVFHKWDPSRFKHKTIGASYDLEKARKYFKMAIEIFDNAKDSNGSAQANFGLANAYRTKQESCKHYDISLEKFDPNGRKFPINRQFKDFPEMVNAFKEKYCK